MYSQTQKTRELKHDTKKTFKPQKEKQKRKRKEQKEIQNQLENKVQSSNEYISIVFVQSLRHFRLFAILWTAAHQASLSFTISWSLLKLMSIKLVMPPNHLILCLPQSSRIGKMHLWSSKLCSCLPLGRVSG